MAINKKLIHFDMTKQLFMSNANGLNNLTKPTNGIVGNIPYYSVVFLKDGYIWTHGHFINGTGIADSISSNATISWSKITDKPSTFTPSAHTQAYTTLTGSGTTANQAIVSSGTTNGWVLKTLGSRAFDSTSYLPLAGGTLIGNLAFSGDNSITWSRNTDYASIYFKNTGDADANSYLGFETGDNGNEYFRFGHNSGGYTEWMSIKSDGVRVKGTKVSLEGHTHDHITSLGNKAASDLSSTYPDGLSVAGIYNNGYPFLFGSTITARGNRGAFQIAGQWNDAVSSLTDPDHPTEMYIRGRRDSYDVWTTWTRVLTNRNWSSVITLPTKSSWNYDDRYLKLTGGTLSGKLNIGSVTTSHATKLEVRTANTTADSVEWGVAVKNPYNDATNYNLGAGIRICLGLDTETFKFGGIAYRGTSTYFNRGKLAFYADGDERAYLTRDNLYIGNNVVCHAGNSSVSLSGSTLTVKINGTSQSLTNTWRGIQNNLTSTSTTDSLSAAQGKALNDKFGSYLPLSGGWMDDSAQLLWKGISGSTSVYTRMGYYSTGSNSMPTYAKDTHNNTKAFYIMSNGYDAGNDWGGLSIDDEGVSVFGAGDAANNFTGVFRVFNEDNFDDGPQFIVTKGSGATTKYSHTAQKFISNVETGTQPYACTSTTVNTNLNADLLDGKHASAFSLDGHTHDYLPLSGGTMTGDLTTTGVTASGTSNRLIFRHLDGQNCNGDYNLYLQYHQSNAVTYFNGGTYYIKGGYYNGKAESANSAGNADTVDSLHGSNLVRFFLSPMESGAPADSAKSWFTGTMPSASGAIIYNVPGSEKTIIAGKSSGSYGHMLQLNYDDTYLRILRYQGGSWKSTDWEKISAGYADNAGYATSAGSAGSASSATKATQDSDGNQINTTYLKKSGGTLTGAVTIDVNTYPLLTLNRTDSNSEVSMYFENATAGWAIGINPWGVGGGVFGIGQYSGTGSSTWRFKIDNNGYCFTSSYLNLGGGHEKNASSPAYVWGSNSSDTYLRSYQTSSLSVNYASSAGYTGTLSATSYINGTSSELPHLIWHIPNVNLGNLSMDTSGNFYFRTSNSTSSGYANLYANLPGYIQKGGNQTACPDGTTITGPGGANILSIRTGATSGRDVGIFQLSDDNAYICNSSDNYYTFAVFDTDLTRDFSSEDTASFCVQSNGAGCKIRGNTVIHSGNIGSQSVASAGSATKLQTARTLWGQSFDGTGNVSGNLTFMTGAGGMYGIVPNQSGKWDLSIYTEGQPRLTIKDGGNVGIGTNNPSYKLDVNGTLHASGATTLSSTLYVGNNATIGGTLGVTGTTTLNSGLTLKANAWISGEVFFSAVDAFRLNYGSYGVIHRNDGGSYWILLTDKNNQDGGFNNLRPFHIDFSTGTVYMDNNAIIDNLAFTQCNISMGGRVNATWGYDLNTNDYYGLYFKSKNSDSTGILFNDDGNVGIGTTSPLRKLHVIGEAIFGESGYVASQGTGSNYSGTWIGTGFMELSAPNPYIDFHGNKSTADYTSRLIQWGDKVRLKYENSNAAYNGYILTCEGNHHNPVILGIFDLKRSGPGSTIWTLDNICGPCVFTLANNWGSDTTFNSNTYWTIPSNLLRVEINGTLGDNYTTKSIVKAASCIGTVMTRWINNQPVVSNRSSEHVEGCSVECLCTDKAPGTNLYYDSNSPGKYIYITGARPYGYDEGTNGLSMDSFRRTGNLSYQRVRFVVYGWLE